MHKAVAPNNDGTFSDVGSQRSGRSGRSGRDSNKSDRNISKYENNKTANSSTAFAMALHNAKNKAALPQLSELNEVIDELEEQSEENTHVPSKEENKTS